LFGEWGKLTLKELDTLPQLGPHADAQCSYCRKLPREVGPLVEGAGSKGSGGVFICGECAELTLAIVESEKQRRETRGLQERSTRITVRRPTLSNLQEHVRKSAVEHDGVLPKESALVLFGSFASLLTWGLLSIEDFQTLMNMLPEYPDDPTVQRMLGR
jgi:hypothetical protein